MPRNSLASPIEAALANAPSFGLPDSFTQPAQTEGMQTPTYTPGKMPFQADFDASARKYGVPVNAIMALAEQESSFNPTALGQPTKYGRAKGLMQYIDSTASAMGINPYDPAQSIDAAARQLKQRLDKGYSMQEAIQAHFGGDNRDQWGPKTRQYGVDVMNRMQKFFDGGKATVSQAQSTGASPAGDTLNYPPAQSAMENMSQSELRSAAIKRAADLEALNTSEPDRYRPLTAEEMAQWQSQQQPAQDKKDPAPTDLKSTLDFTAANAEQEKGMGKIDSAVDYLKRFGHALGNGYDDMSRSMNNAVWLAKGGDTDQVAENIADNMKLRASEAAGRTDGQKRLDTAIKAVSDADGFQNTVKAGWGAVKTAWDEPGAVGLGAAESAASFVPTVAGALSGSAAGGAVGAGVGSVGAGVGAAPGAAVGALWGGRVGMVAGTTAMEAGSELEQMVQEKLDANKQQPTPDNIKTILDDPKFVADARVRATAKGLTVGMVDMLTAGVAGRVLSAPARAAEKKAVATLMDGTNLDEKAARSLLASPAGRAALAAAEPSKLKTALAHVGAFGVEVLGEPVSEAASQAVARDKVDWGDVAAEGIYGFGQAAGGTAVAHGFEKASQFARRNRPAQADNTTGQPDADFPAEPAQLPAPADTTAAAQPETQPAAVAPQVNRDNTGLSDDAGPVERALRGTQQQPTEDNGQFWAGEPGAVIQMQAKDDPSISMAATVERYQNNGEVTVRGDDGTPYTVGQHEVDIVAQSQPEQKTEQQQLQEAGTPEEVKQERQSQDKAAMAGESAEELQQRLNDTSGATPEGAVERQQIEQQLNDRQQQDLEERDTQANTSRMKPATKPAERPQDRPLTDYSEEELRDRMRYLAQQAKNSGWTATLTKARREVEKVLNAKVEDQQQTGTEVSRTQQADNDTAVPARQEGAGSATATADNAAVGRADPGVGADAPATTTGEQSGAPLTGTDNRPKWFATAEKAQQHLDKKGLTGYTVVEVKPKRFEMHQTGTVTNEGTTGTAQNNSPQNSVGQTTRAAQTTKNPRVNRARKLVGEEGQTVSPSGDVGYAKGGEQYRITQIEKNGTTHLTNVASGGSTAITMAEMESGRSRQTTWTKAENANVSENRGNDNQNNSAKPQNDNQSVVDTSTAGREWQQFGKDSKTLFVPRDRMPQIKAEHRGALVNFLNARGIAHKEETVPASSLLPTQAEYSPARVAKAAERTEGDRAILVAADNHIIDGHHQWLAAKEKGEDIRVIRLNKEVQDVLLAAHEFPSSFTEDSQAASKPAKTETKAAGTESEPAKSASKPIISLDGKEHAHKGEPLPANGLSPANIGGDDAVYVGKKGGLHFQIAEAHDGAKLGGWQDFGFVNPQGQFLNREQALDWVNANEGKITPSENMGEELDAADYREQARRRPAEPSSNEREKAEAGKSEAETAVKDADRFAENKLFTADKVAAARARMKKKFGQLNSGLDPELLVDGMTIAGAYIESGVRKFSDYAKAMVEDFGEGVKPYLLSFWEGARNYPNLDTEGMTDVAASAAEHKALLTPEVTKTEAVGDIVAKPATRSRKTGKPGDVTLLDDYGVDHIDGYGVNSSGRETGSDVKNAFLKDTRKYLNAVADRLEDNHGYTTVKDAKGKNVGAVNVNEAGDAVSGDVTMRMAGPDGRGAYVTISGGSMRGTVPSTTSGVNIMYRATQDNDTGQRATNQWAPVDLSANDLADMIAKHVGDVSQRDKQNAERKELSAAARPTGALDDMVSNFDSEVTPSGTTTELGQPGTQTLAGVPANDVQTTAEGRETGRSAAAGRAADGAGDGRTGAIRDDRARSVGDDAGTVPVSTRGERSAGQRTDDQRGGTQRDNGDADAGGRGAARTRPASGGVTAQQKPAALFTINPEEIGTGGKKTKFRNNVAAISLLKQLEAANRQATAEEQAVLSKYVGWGGIPEAFAREDGTHSKGWENEVAELAGIMTPEELQAAAASTRNAHYTSPEIVNAMWDAMRQFGFTGGRLLEPSVGVGNFFGLMPVGMRKASALHGVELDRVTSGIATQLYPDAKIARMGFQDFAIPDGYFDAAIGNPPFGSEKLYDGKRKDLSGFSIHNYFFARSVDALRPGGVMAMVVTNRFLDGAKDQARQYIAQRADFLGAIRLPNNAFAKNAGTEVTTDIIFLRKPAEGETASQANRSWLESVDYQDKDGNTVPLNKYFVTHPENMLGEFGAYGTMYRKGDTALIARDGQNTGELLQAAINRLPSNIMKPAVEVKPETRETVKAESVRVGSAFMDGDGRVLVRGEDELGENTATPMEFRSVKAEERVKGMIRVRDSLSRLRQLQLSDTASDRAIDEARDRLNKTYDSFVKSNGPINSQANKLLFRDDPTWPQISALEDNYDRGVSAAVSKSTGEAQRKESAQKAAIFTKRTQRPYAAPTEAASAKDALVASLAERGRVDMDMMSQLYGKSPETIANELGELLYNAPGEGWQTRDQYLSGNVKQKLAQAREAAKTDPSMARNVEALEAVQPKDIEAVDINVKPGAVWVPTDTMAAFADHLAESTGSTAFYNPLTARWSFPKLEPTSSAQARFGTSRMTVANIIEAATAQKAVQVYDNHRDGSRTLNETETQLANDKVNAVKQEWDNWIWQDDARRQQLHRLYNDQFNTDVQREFDGSHLTFPGKVSDDIIRLRPHQGNFVWRVVQGGSTLADHVVGAGKTFSLIAAAMELRRMGLARKPVFAVPNHLVGQWAQDFIKLYPGANILAATKKDFEKGNRKRFFARIATGDWDAVIVAHSSFGKVGVKPESEAAFIREEIDDLTSSIAAIEEAEGKRSRNVKQAQERKAKMEERLKKLVDADNKDDSLYWDDLGIDALFVDEAHEFKNLAYSTGMRNVAGLGSNDGSQKATDLYMKTRIVRKATGGRNVVFATGTPISNTMAEMYTQQRYLDRDNLKAQGLAHFDAWARNFGEVVTDWELSPSGQYKMNSRFAKFVNMPELMQRYSSFADVINRDDINRMLAAQGKRLPVPKVAGGKPQNVVVERSADQAGYIGEPIRDADGVETDQYPEGTLVYRAEHLPKKAEKGADNMLKIMSDARKAALDMRLIDPSLPDNPYSKVNKAADSIMDYYDRWYADRGTQLVFIDLSTPKSSRGTEGERIRKLIADSESNDPDVAAAAQEQLDRMSPDELLALESDFSVYDDLRQKLIDRGMPADQIAFIHDAKTDLQKTELFGKVRSGRIRVLLGSTSKMGAGMNVQDRLVALHHLDAPWRPSDLEQREGRIIRQGNTLYDRDPEGFEVGIHRYATKQTLDSRMWQTIESKANFIEQVRKGATGVREVEDIGGEAANAAEMKAASSGNPLILEEMTLRQRIRSLENERTAFNRDQFRIRDRITEEERQSRNATTLLDQLQADVKLPQPAKFEVTIGGQTFDKRKDAGEAIMNAAAKMELDGIEHRELGNYGGFGLSMTREYAGKFTLSLHGKGTYDARVAMDSADPTGVAMRMTNAVKDLDGAIEQMQERKAANEKAIPALKAQVKEWGKDDQLQNAVSRHAEVIEQLRPKKKEQAEKSAGTNETLPSFRRLSEEKQQRITSVRDAIQQIVDGADEAVARNLRPDLAQFGGDADVHFMYGDRKKGLQHIGLKRDPSVVGGVLRAVAIGQAVENVPAKKTVRISHDGYTAVLSLDENGKKKTWLLTGWENDRPDAKGEVGTQSPATQSTPTFSRDELGAGLKHILGTPSTEGNTSLAALKRLQTADRTLSNDTVADLRKAITSEQAVPADKLSELLSRVTGGDTRKPNAAHVERLLTSAEKSGQYNKEGIQLARWLLRQYPHLTGTFFLRLANGDDTDMAGSYNTAMRLITLFSDYEENGKTVKVTDAVTAVHEIMHHLERMLPPEAQNRIAGMWMDALQGRMAELKAAGDDKRAGLLADLVAGMYGDNEGRARAIRALQSGELPASDYQYATPSEYWAENGARIIWQRHNDAQVANSGWIDRAVARIKAIVARIRKMLGRTDDSARNQLEEALDSVLDGDGQFVSDSILAAVGDARYNLREEFAGDYSSPELAMPKGLKRDTTIPTEAQDNERVRSWWDRVKNAPRDLTTDAMRKGLAVIPMRPLVTEMARNLPGAAEYMRLKQSMDAMRSRWHARTDEVAQKWLQYRKSNKEENVALMNLMHESTIEQVDPSESFATLMTDRDRDALRTAVAGSEQENELLAKAAKDKRRREVHKELSARYRAMSPEAKAVYKEVRDAYTAVADEYERILLQNMEKAINVRIKKAERDHRAELRRITDAGLTGTEKQDAVADADKALRVAKTKTAWNRKARITQLRQQFETERLAGPYFPLARFGHLFVTVRNATTGAVESFSRFEKAREQREFAELMRENKEYTVQVGTLDDSVSLRKAIDPNFVADVEDILADLPNAELVKDEVWQRYLETLPDLSVRKNRIHRTNREGFNADALRAFGNQMFHSSHQLARLAHSFDMEEALAQAREEAGQAADPVREGLVVNELDKRHDFVMNPTGGPIVQKLSQAAFIFMLAASPKAAIVNLTQTVIMGIPILGAFDGGKTGFIRATNQLSRALSDFARGKGWAQNSARLTADERKAMEEGYDTGIIDRTQSHDLAGIGETGVEYSPGRAKVMAALSWGFHHGERLNREVTYLAAYRMARAKGFSHAAAVQKANDLTWKTHFDYQNTSRPRVMHNDTMKALLVFRNFTINMLYRLFRDVHQAVKGDSAAVKREARIQLAGTTGMMMLSAGITGTWGFGLLMVLGGMFMDDDQDPEDELKKNMVEALGPMMAGIILDGAPGYLTGTNLTDSIGMKDLWFRSPSTQLEGKQEAEYWKSQLLGAVPSIGDNMFRGWQLMKEGQTYRGIEAMMPKAIKDPMKAYRYATEGATNKRGDVVVDNVTAADVIRQALGFTPAKLAEQYDINNANYSKQEAILGQRKQLMDQWYQAEQKGDDSALDKLEKEIDKYNDKYPEEAILPKNLRQSAKTRDRNAEDATGGMRYNRKLRDRILEEQAPSIYK